MRRLFLLCAFVLASAAVAEYPDTDPQDAVMLAARGQINRGDVRDGIRTLEGLLSTRRENADVLSMLGYAHRLLGEAAVARRYYSRALGADPNHMPALSYAGKLELEAADFEAARAHLARLYVLCPTGCEPRAALETAFAQAGVAPPS